MNTCFRSAEILLPTRAEPEKWAVIACDQYTSDLEYWNRVRNYVGDAPSTLHMILPEAELQSDNSKKVNLINRYMKQRLEDGTFTSYSNAYVYVERTLKNGSVRQGIIGMIDLEQYDYRVEKEAMVRATEKTVLERIPPRMEIRKNAHLEFTHVLMLCDDAEHTLIEPIGQIRENLQKLYEFELMEGGGHIAGWLVNGEYASALDTLIAKYESEHVYLVGDGNHSLLTAKTCYENLKQSDPNRDWSDHPARYALVELENVHAEAMAFEPIYRIITDTDTQKLLADLQAEDTGAGETIDWIVGTQRGQFKIDLRENELPIGALQRFLDAWLAVNPGEIDYIHDEEAVLEFAAQPNTIGFLMSTMAKKELFPFITAGNLLSRKAFSLGHGAEKRYYLEGRKIQ